MKVKDLGSLWGIPIMYFKDYGKRYKFISCLLFLADILAVMVATVLMYYNHVSYEVYWFIILLICFVVHMIIKRVISPERWEAFKFYKKYGDCTLEEKTYRMTETNLFSVLYCIGYRRLKRDKSFEHYCDSILSACSEDTRRARQITKYMKNYEDTNGNITCYIIRKGRHSYFVDIKEHSFKEDIINGSNNDN